jgi:hypothetical protein
MRWSIRKVCRCVSSFIRRASKIVMEPRSCSIKSATAFPGSNSCGRTADTTHIRLTRRCSKTVRRDKAYPRPRRERDAPCADRLALHQGRRELQASRRHEFDIGSYRRTNRTGSLIARTLCDVHEQYVWRLLRAQKIDLSGRKSWCESNDPDFVAEGYHCSPFVPLAINELAAERVAAAVVLAAGIHQLADGRSIGSPAGSGWQP